MTLRNHANDQGNKLYDEEYDSATIKREETINHWKERNPDSMLADDPLSIYRTSPADLMNDLDEIDREAIRCGRRKYVALLREAEKKMQALTTFSKNCGLVTGQRNTVVILVVRSQSQGQAAPEATIFEQWIRCDSNSVRLFHRQGEKVTNDCNVTLDRVND